MECEVALLDEVEQWYLSLVESDDDDAPAVTAAIDYLEREGPTLGRPVVDKVKGSRVHNMKELRPSGTSIRILFVFDPSGRRSCWSRETRPASGRSGTSTTSPEPKTATKRGSKSTNIEKPGGVEHGATLARGAGGGRRATR